MSKILVIVESPSKSKTIKQYLGEDYEVLSSKGHIRDLSIKGVGGLGLDIENNFTPQYSVIKDKSKVIKELNATLKNVDEVYLATDPDREGEAISWHLKEVLKIEDRPIKRVIFNEITKKGVVDGVNNPRDIDYNLVSSQETRRILDRIIGFKLSKLLQNKIKSRSAGRVQSVALKLIVDKEKEILAFIEEEYWKVIASFEGFDAELSHVDGKKVDLKTKEETDALVDSLSKDFNITSVETKSKKRESKRPFITSTLQQEASTKLRFGSQKTMVIAQKLYEGIQLADETVGLITYMRTDSFRLSSTYTDEAFEFIDSKYGKEYVGVIKKIKVKKNVQDAHEAIRPTSIKYIPENLKSYLSPDELKLYKMIYARALASLMKPAMMESVQVKVSNNNTIFKASSSRMIFDGYLKVYGEYESVEHSVLPKLEKDTILNASNIEKTQHFTKPPARYSEAKLIKEMEELGIGRPSTYSQTISTLKYRSYITSKDRKFTPTEQGILTTDKLDEFFSDIINIKYTANMELTLDEIASGNELQTKVVSEFYYSFLPLVEKASEEMEAVKPKFTGEDCPKCGSPMVFRNSRYGVFEACSAYPECKYIKQNGESNVEVISTGIKCTKCKKGEIVEREAKRGKNKGNKFYACNNYPKCKNILMFKPTGDICPKCGALLMKNSEDVIICQNTKTCGYEKE